MGDEKKKVLEMIQEGKISAAEGMDLLTALEEGEETTGSATRLSKRFLRVRVDDAKENKVNIKIPLGILRVTSKFLNMGMKLIPEEARREMEEKGIDLSAIDFEELVGLIDEGLSDGKLVDIDTDDAEGRTKVEVYVG